MKDKWASSDSYEYFMGRWSRLVAKSFINWLSPAIGLKWLDIGCGPGVLGDAIIKNCEPAELTAIDQSEAFVNAAKEQLGRNAHCRVGDALHLPVEDLSVDITVSGLVLNFVPEPEKALAEMKRVTVPGGVVALYIWDYAGKMDFLSYFWEVAAELNPEASALHEAKRFPGTNADTLEALFSRAGFVETIVDPIEIETHFFNFDDYWKPFMGGQGPAPTYLSSLDEQARDNLRVALNERLPIQPDGSVPMLARAWAVKSQV